MNMKAKVIEILASKYPDGATPEQMFDELYNGGCVNDPSIRLFVVGSEFYQMMRTDPRMAIDIESELGETYGLHPKHISKIRRKFLMGGRQRKRDPRAGK